MKLQTALWVMLATAAASCDGPTPPPAGHPRIIWSVGIAGASLRPSFDSANVYFADQEHRMFQVARRDGRRGWTTQNSPVGGPGLQRATGSVVAGPVVAIPNAYVFGLNRTDGTVRWRSPVSCFSHTAVTDGQTVYAGCGDGRTFAFDATTGATRWETRVADDTGGVIFNPVVHSDTVYVGYLRRTNPFTGGLGAIDAKTGARIWYREFEPRATSSETSSRGDAKVVNDVVVATSDGGEIYALARASGTVRWMAPRVPLSSQAVGDIRPLAVVGQTVVAGSTGGLVVAYSAATGTVLWEKQLQGSILIPFASDDRRVFIVDLAARILALEASSGAIAWSFGSSEDPTMMILGPPALRGDTIFVGGARSVFALRAQ